MANTESDAQSRDSESQQHIQHPTINLPKGGGAIRGMGEKFQANAVTGSGSFSIPLPLSSGRGDFTPQLSLSYNSGSGNSAFGLGWTIDVPAIRRKTDKTLPRYAEDSDTFILSGAEDLVPVLEQKGNDWQKVEQVIEEAGIQYHVTRYRPRIEGLFARIEKWQADFDIHWRAITKDNVTSIYGQTSEARIADNEHPRRIFAWLLEKSYDAKGNRIVYEYQAENNDNIENRLSEWQRLKFGFAFQQKYLKRVKYTPFVNQPERYHLQLVFDYGEHTSNTVEAVTPWPVRSDPFSEYKAGFEIRTYRLCQRILMFHNFPAEGEADHWVLVKATELTYESHPHLTYLTQVTQRGYHGETHKALPPLTFTYSRPEIATTLQQVDEASRAHLPMGLDQAQYQWIDLEGEGLSGVLSQHAGQLYYQNNAGDGRLGSMRALTQQPLTLGNLQVSDINNDGVQELVLRGDSLNGYFEYQEGHWENFVPFEQQLTFDLTDPNIKLLDLTGDGLADVLITEGEVFTWYQSQGQKGFSTGGRFFAGSEEEAGPRIVFADSSQSIFLSDMSGDGLTDIVRIRNGEVCYWPNLGYGRFGRKVDMENAPRFTVNPEDFNPRNIQLGDLDGSGTTDIFYVGNGQIEYWLNQAGNRFSAKQLIDFPLPFDSLTALSLIDFTGNGTLSLVWSTRRPGMETHQLSYLPLFNSKPHLLIEVDNHLGHLTRLQYAASTRYYLADKQAGTPWVTKLPFPVQVLAQVEHLDLVAGGRLVTEYTYHHGYYDAYEREFRGFGRVDVLDTESFADSSAEPQHYVRPILTKSWYHNGAYVTADKISKQYEQEYYAGDAQAFLLADTIIEEALDGQNLREAYRALKGSALRQEIYELGNSIPYQITEANFKVKRLQPLAAENAYAVFYVHPHESLTFHYEQNTQDPRMGHNLTLEVDDYGNVRKALAIGYGRRPGHSTLSGADRSKQEQTLITYTETDVTNGVDETHAYRTPAPCETRTYELTGYQPPVGQAFQWATFAADQFAALTQAEEIAYEAQPDPSRRQKRLIERERILYRKHDLSGPLALGQIDALGLPYESYKLAFTPGLLAIYGVDGLQMQQEGKYVDLDANGHSWIPSGQQFYSPAITDTTEQERAYAQQHFFLPHRFQDPFEQTTLIRYDRYDLLITETVDPLGNRTLADNDYRVLQPRQVTDPNGNSAEVAFDSLGMVVGSAMSGKNGEGDSLAGFVADLSAEDIRAFLSDPRGQAAPLLQQASTRILYDLQRFADTGQPVYAATLAREIHVSELASEQVSPIQISFAYSDGFEREVQQKIMAEAGQAPQREPHPSDPTLPGTLIKDNTGKPQSAFTATRWVGTGRKLYNNKGKPVKQYEPFFSTTHLFESEAEMVLTGVTPILFYDPLERVVATLHPNHSYEKVVFDPWQQATWDVNDTVLQTEIQQDPDIGHYFQNLPVSSWYQQRIDGSLGEAEATAAQKAAVHANTPTLTHFDALGRAFLSIADNGEGQHYATRTVLDIEGNQRAVIDAKDRVVMRYDYDMLSNRIHQASMEAGQRWHLNDVAAKPIYQWNSRGYRVHTQYDALRRPLAVWVSEHSGAEQLIEKMVYGESQPQPEGNNLRGQVYQAYDSAGVVTNASYDFKGNLLQSQRQMAVAYKTRLDWSQHVALETEVYSSSTRYDALNRPIILTTPDNSRIAPSYNEANLLERVAVHLRGAEDASLFVTNIDYNAKGQREQIEYGNGVKTLYAYDEDTYRLIQLQTLRGAERLQDLYYTYDPAGNITRIRDQAQQTVYFNNTVVEPQADYTYDALYRLIHASGREHIGQTAAPQSNWNDEFRVNLPHPHDGQALRRYTERYDYDEVGNILELIHQANQGNWTRRYRYEEASQLESGRMSNRLSGTAMGETAEGYEHDVHGNMTAMPHVREMVWDFEDQLQVVDLGGGGKAYYVYDAAGQRVRKVVERQNGTRQKERIYLGGFEVYREYEGSGAVSLVRESLHVMDDKQRIALVEMRTVGEDDSPSQLVRYQLGNHLGSVSLELDAQGRMISYEEYYPYGSTAYQGVDRGIKAARKRYRYTGKERDEETGLYYHGARYYACWVGRWTAADPIGVEDGVNVYGYVNNNPVKFQDATGREGEAKTEQPWWRFTKAGFQYQTGRHDIFTPHPGYDTGFAPLNLLVNTFITVNNICTIPINGVTELAALPEEGMRFLGMSEQDIEATNFTLMMTPIGGVNALSTGLRSIQTTKRIAKVEQLFKKATRIGNEVINKAKRIIGEKIIRRISKKASKIGIPNNGFIRFVNKYDEHIVFRDFDVPRKRGIGGAHNKDEFFKYSNEFKVEDVVPHPTLEGIETIRYRMAALDKMGNPTGQYQAAIPGKTVYDPSKISDKQFLNWGRQAAAEAQTANRLNREWVGTAPNGLEFRGYLDDRGAVKSFFPNF